MTTNLKEKIPPVGFKVFICSLKTVSKHFHINFDTVFFSHTHLMRLPEIRPSTEKRNNSGRDLDTESSHQNKQYDLMTATSPKIFGLVLKYQDLFLDTLMRHIEITLGTYEGATFYRLHGSCTHSSNS